MSPFGTEPTCRHVRLWSLLGAKRTWLGHSGIDAFDPTRTWPSPRKPPTPVPECYRHPPLFEGFCRAWAKQGHVPNEREEDEAR